MYLLNYISASSPTVVSSAIPDEPPPLPPRRPKDPSLVPKESPLVPPRDSSHLLNSNAPPPIPPRVNRASSVTLPRSQALEGHLNSRRYSERGSEPELVNGDSSIPQLPPRPNRNNSQNHTRKQSS